MAVKDLLNITHILLEDATANANGEALKWTGTGIGTLHVFGTWDTATITIEGSLDGITWTPLVAASYTADTITTFEAGISYVRGVLSSVGGSTSVSAYLAQSERP